MFRPVAAVAVGMSAAHGAFLSNSLQGSLPEDVRLEDAVQRAVGLDAEYSAGRFLSRGEVIWANWTLPVALTGPENERLGAVSALVEARYRIFPGVHIAARGEHFGFSQLPTATGLQTWEAAVTRVELGGGYSIMRNVMVKASWQRNIRDGGRVRTDSLGALQVVYWF